MKRDRFILPPTYRQNRPSPYEIKMDVRRRLLESLDLGMARQLPVDELYTHCSRQVDVLLSEQHCPLSIPEKDQLLREVMDEIFGWGPLEELLRDSTISDILVNGADQIYIERDGKLHKTAVAFRDDDQLMQVIQRIGARVGRRIDESAPMLDARLADGSRVNAIIPPLSLDGPLLSIRRFGTITAHIDSLVELESMTKEMAQFLCACVRCKTNVLISGGTGTGKTTLLNVLSASIPGDERVVTIEDAAELQLQREHVVRLEVRPPNLEGKGEFTQRDLLRNALRMRPDRIIIGEVRGIEALEMLQAMNTGHEGSMTTIHANSSRDAFRRLEVMISMAGLNIPMMAFRQQISSALNLVIQLDRLTGGARKVMSIAEVSGMENDTILLQEIFRYCQTGVFAGHAQGRFEATGIRPQILKRLESEGVPLPASYFNRQILRTISENREMLNSGRA